MAQSERFFYYSFLLVGITILLSGIVYAVSLVYVNSPTVPMLIWILAAIQIIAGVAALISVTKLFKEYG